MSLTQGASIRWRAFSPNTRLIYTKGGILEFGYGDYKSYNFCILYRSVRLGQIAYGYVGDSGMRSYGAFRGVRFRYRLWADGERYGHYAYRRYGHGCGGFGMRSCFLYTLGPCLLSVGS